MGIPYTGGDSMTTYKYSVGDNYVEVEKAGRFTLNPGENAEDKAKALIASTQSVNADDIELEKVDDVSTGVITSEDAPARQARKNRK